MFFILKFKKYFLISLKWDKRHLLGKFKELDPLSLFVAAISHFFIKNLKFTIKILKQNSTQTVPLNAVVAYFIEKSHILLI